MKKAKVKVTFKVPSWARYIAQDQDGEWYAYEYKPRIFTTPETHTERYPSHWMQEEGQNLKIGITTPTKNSWEKSRSKVK
jgi:hypothetical protein